MSPMPQGTWGGANAACVPTLLCHKRACVIICLHTMHDTVLDSVRPAMFRDSLCMWVVWAACSATVGHC